MENKICPRCKLTKAVSEFQKNKCAKDGYQYHCKVCRKVYDNAEVKQKYNRNRYHVKNDSYRDWAYQRHFGISLIEYNLMLEQQEGVCKICGKVCKTGQRLAVDHCHTTKNVRGLLCMECNRGLGAFKDNVDLLQKAIYYLERSTINE